MIPAFVDVGWLGSPVDVLTFIVVVLGWRRDVRPRLDGAAAGVVAVARSLDDVHDRLLARDLDVDEREVRPLRSDGGDDRGR